MNSLPFFYHPALHARIIPLAMNALALWVHIEHHKKSFGAYVQAVAMLQQRLRSKNPPEDKPSGSFVLEPGRILVLRHEEGRLMAAARAFEMAIDREAARRQNVNPNMDVFAVYSGLVLGNEFTDENFHSLRLAAEVEIRELILEDGQEAADAIAYAIFSAAEKGLCGPEEAATIH